MFSVTPSTPHDSKIMEDLIINNNFSNKFINLIGDLGYIKSKEYIDLVKKNYNINIITGNRKNAINPLLLDNNTKALLNKRYIVENFFALLKRCYLRINIINDKKVNIYSSYIYMAASLIIYNLNIL